MRGARAVLPDREAAERAHGGACLIFPLSVTNGHTIISDSMPAPVDPDLTPYLDRLREVPFIRHVELASRAGSGVRPDLLIKLRTPRRTFSLALETKRTFLDQALTNAVVAQQMEVVRKHQTPLLLLARYIPRPTGERLAEAGVNFVDRPGNVHLKLGDDYHVLLLGRREPAPEPMARRPSPALIQLLLVLLADPAAADWPIRRLAEAAGIGKTAAATGRQRLVQLGVVAQTANGAHRVTDHWGLADDFLMGYNQVLRPHLFLGRFRAPERDPGLFLKEIARAAKQTDVKWAITGGPAAYALERFYRGEDVPLFVAPVAPALQRALRLVADRRGPVTLLRGFGHQCTWRVIDDVTVAHPWLIYAELLHSGEPRALEAAEQIRETYLKA